ncbi:lysoplasmalogenase [Sandaracinobacter sp. RS1-74]|uniref:lysoplasmalogenase family protein n=1 Tax=Sandaracinobacteroides sayramensis TaxID=2913411 RepID=UPI001EDA5108|nr:lysoplasmalogenase family protein [Sandaracinobacteroides sayramensis]MCG2841658.1 lysoplasmalogenase [Sandaracinobacteroides sayramensis]
MKSPLLLAAALVAGISYMASWGLALPDAAAIAWKGAGVGLLATWASRQGRSVDHALLATVLTLGAAADMLLEVIFVAGAAVFALGHVVAIALYARNRRPGLGAKDLALAAALVGGGVAAAYHLASPDWAPSVAVYTLFLALMAAAALMSRFALAGVGALLFLLSDLLIFARMDSLSGARWADFAIWGSYFAGQALIAWGVASGLRSKAAR